MKHLNQLNSRKWKELAAAAVDVCTCSCCVLNMSGRGEVRTSSASWAWLSMLTGMVALLDRKLL